VVIVDEYGGFEGLLAHGNIVERLIGKAAPAPSSELAIQSLSEGRWLVNGSARLDEVNRELEIELDAEGVETVGGLVFNRFGYLPKPGERLELDGVTIKVKRTARNRVTQLEIRVAPTNDEGGGT
jgi:CBS domain containing-hemolysin-like protein